MRITKDYMDWDEYKGFARVIIYRVYLGPIRILKFSVIERKLGEFASDAKLKDIITSIKTQF